MEELLQHLFGIDLHLCPVCRKGHLHLFEPLLKPKATDCQGSVQNANFSH
ncbi:hypothetical protein [Candidatus Venteria ishoeyi]|nr:hypothetical protein [Candidatus Venteria ishoeyi]